jgi:serine/threonine-protein kinase
VLSGFTLTDVLGAGSLGQVYKARSDKDDGWFAVKVVPRRNVVQLAAVAEKVKAFKEVRHPRVSALVAVGTAGDRAYLVWPLLEGGETLDAFVRRQGKLPPRLAAQIAFQTAAGLQLYHERGLFHGLLKPSDVLIGADRRVRVLDFGVGFLLACERGKSMLDTMTNGKAPAHGLDCASPESIMDPLARTPAGDQYSLGCVLYFCLTGRYPFTDDNPVKKMLAHQAEEPTPIRELAPETPPRLAAVVHRLLRKTPEERYEGIADVVRELQALTANPRGLQTPASRPVARPVAPFRPAAARSGERKKVAAPPAATARDAGKGGGPAAWQQVLGGLAVGAVAGLLVWLIGHH